MTVHSTLAMRSGRFVLVIATVRCFYDVASKMPAEYVVALRVRSELCRSSFVDLASWNAQRCVNTAFDAALCWNVHVCTYGPAKKTQNF